jgi:hypothetical protein
MIFHRPGGAFHEVASRDPDFVSAPVARRGPQASPLDGSSQANTADAWTLALARPRLRRRLSSAAFPNGALHGRVKSEQHGPQCELGTE